MSETADKMSEATDKLGVTGPEAVADARKRDCAHRRHTRLPAGLKRHIVAEYLSGKSAPALSEEYGIHPNSVRGWVRKTHAGDNPFMHGRRDISREAATAILSHLDGGGASGASFEVLELWARVSRLERENEILRSSIDMGPSSGWEAADRAVDQALSALERVEVENAHLRRLLGAASDAAAIEEAA